MSAQRGQSDEIAERILQRLIHDAELVWGKESLEELRPTLTRLGEHLRRVAQNVPSLDETEVPAFFWEGE